MINRLEIDYALVHNKSCEYFSYVGNFLKDDAPLDQIFEELRRTLLDVAYGQRDMEER